MSSTLSEFGEEFSQRFRWDQLPIYVCLAGIVTWVGMLTVIVLTEHGVPPEQLGGLVKGIGLLTFVVAASPFIGPTVGMAARRLR